MACEMTDEARQRVVERLQAAEAVSIEVRNVPADAVFTVLAYGDREYWRGLEEAAKLIDLKREEVMKEPRVNGLQLRLRRVVSNTLALIASDLDRLTQEARR